MFRIHAQVIGVLILVTSTKETDVKYVKPGRDFVLKCNRSENNSSLNWYYYLNSGAASVTLSEDADVNPDFKNKLVITDNGGYHLKILNFTVEDEGIYKCTILVDNKIIPVDFNLQMIEAPQNIEFVNNNNTGIVNGTEGQVLNVTCQVIGGKPQGGIYWKRFLSNGTVFNTWPFSTIEFIPEYEHHLMNLTCGVSHEMLDNNIETLITLNILHKPKIQILQFPSGDIKEGQLMTLTCLYESNPPETNITWTKDERVLSLYSVYEKTNMQTNDSGNYTCKVSNSIGAELENILILVNKCYDKHTNDTDCSCQNGSLKFVLIYVCVCSCGTFLFGSAACFIPICKRVKRWCTVSDEKPTVLEGQTLSTQ